MIIKNAEDLKLVKEKGMAKLLPKNLRIAVGMGTCGIGNGAQELFSAFKVALAKRKMPALLTKVGCFGFCSQEPLVNISLPGKPLVILNRVLPKEADSIVRGLARNNINPRRALCKIETWDHLTGQISYGKGFEQIPDWNKTPFFKWQKKIVLRDCGLINPEDIEEYIAVGGYRALLTVLRDLKPEAVIAEVKKSKLRGRGGAGFPTGLKWELMRKEGQEEKYIICNADEGDPGAYMNRNESESDPHMLLEGMIIGAYAMGASRGVIYVRAEYPLAVERIRKAIADARSFGLLGDNIFNSGFSFNLQLVEGAGAFVCGEETALISSLEGKSGRPHPRPPFPAQKGYLGKPTNINNVETWSNIPVVIAKGADWFTQTGTQNSSGTKVFSLVGKIKNTGLVELPLGSTLQTLIYNIGAGTGTNKKIKAVQSGGPSGGCIPASLFNTPIDYETLASLGAIMGSGGMVVMDDDNCMVDVARYFTEFTTSESCGKCTPCREGLTQSLNILTNITKGKAIQDDIQGLQDLGAVIKDTALCGLGQTGPNPVLTTLKYFRGEYEEHIKEQRCDGGVCSDLFVSPCENSCPLHMNIPGFLELFKEGKIIEAFECVIRDNPFPSSSGRICHFHCKMRCRREDIDYPVSQGEIHRYIADQVYKTGREARIIERLAKERLPKTGKKICIVGAGPCGLTAAFYLSRLGHDVIIYEANPEAGGVLRYGIPEYRLPKAVLKKEIAFIQEMGAKILCNKKINADNLNKKIKGADAVFLATGAYKNMGLGIPGEGLKGVLSGTEFLKDVAVGKEPLIGKKVLVIGAGNVAVDAARTALRFGSEVTIVYRREKTDMPANKDEIKGAESEGVKFIFLASPKAIQGNPRGRLKGLIATRMILGDYDLSGRRRPVATDEFFEIPCDTVILAIGEKVDAEFIKGCGILVNQNGTVKAGRFDLKTSLDKVYAGGDLVMGPATAVEAMSDGKKAARIIDLALSSEDRFAKLFRKFTYKSEIPLEPKVSKRLDGGKLGINKRRNNFREVSLGLSLKQAIVEVNRCLRCDIKEGK
ncbi:MAG: FAD-dependent oxidoreductase [Candidatus Omnitrophica bacterium]|nr:FAD-dependent oxidoreductase [Candidatus Omnitrophota bacterium]MDD5690349.1 FAD-dependent oxidoreductase [Candidatus Omnitrophota bacterium]